MSVERAGATHGWQEGSIVAWARYVDCANVNALLWASGIHRGVALRHVQLKGALIVLIVG